LTVNLTYDGSPTAPTDAGSYVLAATINEANYAGSATGTLVIAKTGATVTLDNLAPTYDGTAKVATATTTPAGLTVNLTYDGSPAAPTDADSYAIAATINEVNYAGSATGTLVIAKAGATVTLDNLAHTYDGTPKAATATTTPAGLTVNLTYDGSPAAPTDADSYVLAATINEVNYAGSATGTLVIRPANDWASWCNHYFTELEQSAGLAHDNSDPDADGWMNLAEYALGSNPRQFTPPLVPTLDSNGLALTFTRPANLPGVTYAAESSDDLDVWSPIQLDILEWGTTETVRVLDPLLRGDPSRRFLRLRFGR
jgi:hypothetical protein